MLVNNGTLLLPIYLRLDKEFSAAFLHSIATWFQKWDGMLIAEKTSVLAIENMHRSIEKNVPHFASSDFFFHKTGLA